MAQRSNPDTRIDAVELLKDDAHQSVENIVNSPWPDKISVTNSDIQAFTPSIKYNLIVCNPPFFSNSLLPPVEMRSKVRHNTTLTLDDLIASTIRLLSPHGKLCAILPVNEGELFIKKINIKNLFLNRLTRFFSRSGKPQERSLLEIGFSADSTTEDSLILYQSMDQWTDEYRMLTSEFYLDR